MLPARAPSRVSGRDLAALTVGALGLLLTFAAPDRRLDLRVLGVAATFGGMFWAPGAGPFLTAAALPFFFFDHPLVGPLSVTAPGLAVVLAWAAALVRLAVDAARHRASWLRLPATGYDAPLALFLLSALLSLLVTEYLLLSVRQLRADILEPVLFFGLLAALRERQATRWAVAGFLLAATVTSAAAIGQVLLLRGGTHAEGVLRAQAWYPSPNHLALMLGRAFPFFVALIVAAPAGSRAPGRAARALGAVGAAVVGLGILLTFSLGGWIGTAAALAATVVVSGRRRLALGLAALAVVILATTSGLALAHRLPQRLDPARQTSGFRIDLWQSSVAMGKDHPILGVGLDNFVYLYQQVYLLPGAAAQADLSHPHNWILNFWLQLGILGLAAFLWLQARFWRALWRGSTSNAPPWLVAGAAGSMADMLVHGFVDNSYFLVDLAFIFWLLLAIVRPGRVAAEGETAVNDPLVAPAGRPTASAGPLSARARQ